MFVVTLASDKEIVIQTPSGPVVVRVNTKRRRVAIDAPHEWYIHLRPIEDHPPEQPPSPEPSEPQR